MKAVPFSVDSTPKVLVDYNRERAISDEIGREYLEYVIYENTHVKGRSVIDVSSGLPVVDQSGELVREDGLFEAIGMRNDIGGYSLRVPASDISSGFKGTNASFISTLPASGRENVTCVSFVGKGDGFVTGFGYNAERKYLSVNDRQGFIGVEPLSLIHI